MAGAYATIANDGVYREATFYTRVVANNGSIVLNSEQYKRKAFSEAVAYVTKKLLTQPVQGTSGTATYCAIKGMEVAAKTGTTNEDFDRWLCGFTNDYTAVAWFGYDLSERIEYAGKNPAGEMWANVMQKVHSNLENSQFKEAKDVVSVEICKDSFMRAKSSCKNTYTEYFLSETEPGFCTKH